jgi:hypothetical protein
LPDVEGGDEREQIRRPKTSPSTFLLQNYPPALTLSRGILLAITKMCYTNSLEN